MDNNYVADTVFEDRNFGKLPLITGVYEGCTFKNCSVEKVNLSGCQFIETTFADCNISLANIANTVFNAVHFSDCKMTGLIFGEANKFGLLFSFDDCSLNHSSFYNTHIKNTHFKNCQIKEVDFSNCNAKGVVFYNCDLGRAIFDNTNLEEADFSTALNFSIDPENNKLKKAMFSQHSLDGL